MLRRKPEDSENSESVRRRRSALDSSEPNSSWSWVERLYEIQMEMVERVSVVESRVDRLETLISRVGASDSEVKAELKAIRDDLEDIKEERKKGADLMSKLKYDVIKWAVILVLSGVATLVVGGFAFWVRTKQG